jgi:hypothetical protein
MAIVRIRWRRLDTPGHDTCALEGHGAGWTLDGVAGFESNGLSARLSYHVACDLEWRSLGARVTGSLGPRSVDLRIARTAGGAWALNDEAVPSVGDVLDLDLGFTPATNVLPVRRLALAVGQAAAAPAAWLDVTGGTLELLVQRYERRTESTYWYESPTAPYADFLEVDAIGFVRRYPGLWEAE